MERQKNAIITGAYGAIGTAITMHLAQIGFSVVVIGRREDQLRSLTQRIKLTLPEANISFSVVDLSRKAEIQNFFKLFHGNLNLLVNNAATSPPVRSETPEGIEIQWATNVLGYFWMIHYSSPFMEGQENARIVNVASYWAGELDLNDPEFKKRIYNNDNAYRQSKQADRMLTVAFSEKLGPVGITVNSCHPGDVNSKLSNNLGFGGSESPDQGAATPVWVATDPKIKGITGKYFEHQSQVLCPFSKDKEQINRLFMLCSSY